MCQTRWPVWRRRKAARSWFSISFPADDAYILGFPELFDDLEGEPLVFGGELAEDVEEFLGETVLFAAVDLVDEPAFGDGWGEVFSQGIVSPAKQILGPNAEGFCDTFNYLNGRICDFSSFKFADVGTTDAGRFCQFLLLQPQITPRYQKTMGKRVTHGYIFSPFWRVCRGFRLMSLMTTLLLDKCNTMCYNVTNDDTCKY